MPHFFLLWFHKNATSRFFVWCCSNLKTSEFTTDNFHLQSLLLVSYSLSKCLPIYFKGKNIR